MSTKQARKIAVVGGSGTIGTHIVAGLLDQGVHSVTVISRADSSASFPAGVNVQKGDYSDESFLLSALHGQEVLVLALNHTGSSLQVPLIQAAAKAGVKWILPNEFGSDINATKLVSQIPMLSGKKQYRDLIEEVGLRWIAIVNNPWFDFSLEGGYWGLDLKKRAVKLYNGGETKFVTTTVASAGRGVAGVLSLPDAELAKYENAPFYLSSFRISQKDILDSLLRVTGTKENEWTVETLDAEEVLKIARAELQSGNFHAAIQVLYVPHMIEGLGGDYSDKDIDMARLGVRPENLDDVVKKVVEKVQAA